MTFRTKFIYEEMDQQAKIQFFDDSIFINEWVAHNGNDPVLVVPSSPGITIYRKEWENAIEREDKWIAGMKNAGIEFSLERELSRFRVRVKKTSNYLSFFFEVRDVSNAWYLLREIFYYVTIDQCVLSERLTSSTIYWVDYISYISLQKCYASFVTRTFKSNLF